MKFHRKMPRRPKRAIYFSDEELEALSLDVAGDFAYYDSDDYLRLYEPAKEIRKKIFHEIAMRRLYE